MQEPTALQKLAVDSAAAEYWSKYFGEYGKSWVRNIPHRVAHALIGKVAELADAAQANKILVRRVGHAVTATGVRIEGVFKYTAGDHTATRLFHAEFDHEGELKSIDSLPITA